MPHSPLAVFRPGSLPTYWPVVARGNAGQQGEDFAQRSAAVWSMSSAGADNGPAVIDKLMQARCAAKSA
jgi:hypothetical protein